MASRYSPGLCGALGPVGARSAAQSSGLRGSGGELEAGEGALGAPVLDDLDERVGAGAVVAVLAAALARLALVVVVAGRARFEEALVEHRQVDDRLHPGRLGRSGRLEHADVVVE